MLSADLAGYVIEKKFKSKKNNVFLLNSGQTGTKGNYLIYKEYSCPNRMQKEVEMLSMLKENGLPVPEILVTGKDYIGLEYLEGDLLLDCYCDLERTDDLSIEPLPESAYLFIHALCSWFKKFYQVTGDMTGKRIIMGDVNFRNFIVKDVMYGIDFEECREGSIEEEIGSLCAFALTYDPSFTVWKKTMVSELQRFFIDELGLDKELLKKEVENQLLFLARIRGRSSTGNLPES